MNGRIVVGIGEIMGRTVSLSIDRAAYDREATRQQAISAAGRCLVAGFWLELRGDVAGAERYANYLRELTQVIVGGPS